MTTRSNSIQHHRHLHAHSHLNTFLILLQWWAAPPGELIDQRLQSPQSTDTFLQPHTTERAHVTPTMAQALKAKGNELFKQGDYSGAEELFSQA